MSVRGASQVVHRRLGSSQLQAVAELFAVLSEPSRLHILQILQGGEASVGQLVEQSGLKQANVSKQLGILTAAGVIARRPDGNRAIYAIAMPMVFDLCAIVCDGVARQAAAEPQRCADRMPLRSLAARIGIFLNELDWNVNDPQVE